MRNFYLFITLSILISSCSSGDDQEVGSMVQTVTLDQPTLGLSVGSTQKLVATINPQGVLVTQTWTSSSVGIASVSKDGVVAAVSPGKAIITFRADDKTATCSVSVGATEATDITMPSTLSLEILAVGSIDAAVMPVQSLTTIKWSSSDESMATVGPDGTIKTNDKTGEVKIIATADKVTKECTLTITPRKPTPPTKIKIQLSLSLTVPETETLAVTFTPTTSSAKISWESKATNIATVSDNGLVTAVGAGTADIVATSDNGLQSTCTVYVTAAPASMNLNFTHAEVVEFKSFSETSPNLMALLYVWTDGVTKNEAAFSGTGHLAILEVVVPKNAPKVADGAYTFMNFAGVDFGTAQTNKIIAGLYLGAGQVTKPDSWLYELKGDGVLHHKAPIKYQSSLTFTTTAALTTLSGKFDVYYSTGADVIDKTKDPNLEVPWIVVNGTTLDEIGVSGSFTINYPATPAMLYSNYNRHNLDSRTMQ